MYARPWIRGFTTNLTQMRGGVRNYEAFARSLPRAALDRPISLEMYADDEEEMERQALTVATWGANVNAKIPVTDRDGVFMGRLVRRLGEAGVGLNVTHPDPGAGVAGRGSAGAGELGHRAGVRGAYCRHGRRSCSADGGGEADPALEAARATAVGQPERTAEHLSGRRRGCDIIALAPEILRRMELVGKNLADYSRETVEMFHRDAGLAAWQIDTSALAAAKAGEMAVRPDAENGVHGVGQIPCEVVGAGIDRVQGAAGI